MYFTLLGSATNVPQRVWAEIHRNIAEILALHEEVLQLIRQAFPDSDVQSDGPEVEAFRRPTSKHGRWRSHDESHSTFPAAAVPTSRRSIEISWLRRPKKAVLISDPREVADVARVFDRMVSHQVDTHVGDPSLRLVHVLDASFLRLRRVRR